MFYKIPLSYFCHWTLLDMKHASKMEKFWFTFPFPSISEPKQAVCLPPLKSGLILQGCIPSVTWKISIVEPGLGKNRVGIKSRDSRNKENSWQVVLRTNQEEQTLFRARNQLEHIRATVHYIVFKSKTKACFWLQNNAENWTKGTYYFRHFFDSSSLSATLGNICEENMRPRVQSVTVTTIACAWAWKYGIWLVVWHFLSSDSKKPYKCMFVKESEFDLRRSFWFKNLD